MSIVRASASADEPTVKATLGSFYYLRYLGLGSFKVGDGDLLYAGEVGTYNGPWTLPGDLVKLNSVLRYSEGTGSNGFSCGGAPRLSRRADGKNPRRASRY
jgi:hypothetical protein